MGVDGWAKRDKLPLASGECAAPGAHLSYLSAALSLPLPPPPPPPPPPPSPPPPPPPLLPPLPV
eukprot:COSAG03_NODE_456_length_7759_cov_122.878068_1_plen_63_part_10